MKLLVANSCTNFVLSYTGGKDDVDNRTNETVIKTTGPADSFVQTPVSSNNNTPTESIQMSSNDLFKEEQRFKTFNERWPHDFISPRILAKTGFYFIGPHDQVRCYFCKVEVSRWESGDNEVAEHSRWSPNCPLLKRRETANVPIEPVAELEQLLPPPSFDVCGPCSGPFGHEVRPNSVPETPFTPVSVPPTEPTPIETNSTASTTTTTTTTTTTATTIERETQTLRGPDFPEYAIEAARLRSFDDWPRTLKQRPKQLSDAGFFYTQKGDRVICFSCGGGLRDWDEQDEPWEQHALWYSKCEYVRLMKGQEYIDAVKAKFESEQNNGALSSSSQESVKYSCGSSGSSTSSTPVLSQQFGDRDEQNHENNKLCGDKDDQNQENNKLCESRLCKICYSSEYNTAFFPCGHVIACSKCASSVTKCPLCRKPFERVMRVFFS